MKIFVDSESILENMEEYFIKLQNHFPFLTYGIYTEEDYVGIVQNSDNHFIHMYVYNNISDEKMRKRFLELGEIWWWESNRKTPINLFLKEQFKMFRPYLKGFNKKEFEIVSGPIISLNDQINRRIKRKSIEIKKET